MFLPEMSEGGVFRKPSSAWAEKQELQVGNCTAHGETRAPGCFLTPVRRWALLSRCPGSVVFMSMVFLIAFTAARLGEYQH